MVGSFIHIYGEFTMQESVVHCPHCGAHNRLKNPAETQAPICGKCKGPLPWIIEGTDISFRREIDAPIPVLVDFWAEWCAPCRMTTPVLEDFAKDQAGRIKIIKMNVDRNPSTAGQFGIRSIPTLILFKNGHPVDTLIGAMSKDALKERVAPHLA
jgi:thioredoxin 2